MHVLFKHKILFLNILKQQKYDYYYKVTKNKYIDNSNKIC